MGNKICKTNSLSGAKNALSEIIDFLSCGETSDDEGREDEVTVSARKFVDDAGYAHRSNAPYSGLSNGGASPVRQQQPRSPMRSPLGQQQALPGESCLVTYDVGALGVGSSAAYPGQSMVVTGSFGQQTRAMEPASPPVVTASVPQLQSTKSFEVEAPYKVGDHIQIWSTSQQAWCNGTVDKGQGEWVHISYKGPEGRLMSKIMPNGHEHLRFQGAAWSNVEAPRGNSLPSSTHSPQKGVPEMPPSPGSAQNTSIGLSVAALPKPPAAVCTYKAGDDVEIWSTSQNAWCQGRVHKAEGEWVHIAYKGPGEQPMTKLMPNGHEDLRFPQVPAYSQHLQQHDFSRNDFLTPVASHDDLPPPPPPTASYKAGDRIEIWSTSQNAWRPGSISKVDGDWVHIAYAGPKGEPMNKIMPNGHAHLRLQAGFAAPP